MSRPLIEAQVAGETLSAVLDTGSRRSYIRSEFARSFPAAPVQPFQVKIGGQTLNLDEGRLVSGAIKDSDGREYRFSTVMFPVADLGSENGRTIHVAVGALVLEDWGACIDESVIPPRVDFQLLRKGELVEL